MENPYFYGGAGYDIGFHRHLALIRSAVLSLNTVYLETIDSQIE